MKRHICTVLLVATLASNVYGQIKTGSAVSNALEFVLKSLKSGETERALEVSRSLYSSPLTPKSVKGVSFFFINFCRFSAKHQSRLGKEFQTSAQLIDNLPQKEKKWIWEVIQKASLRFSPSYIPALYKKNKKISLEALFDNYLGISVFLGGLNQIRSIQEAQKINFSMLDILEDGEVKDGFNDIEGKKSVILEQIQVNQEFLQILTKNSPIEVGQPAM